MTRSLIILPDDSAQPVLDAIHAASKSVRVKMFAFSHQPLLDAIVVGDFLKPETRDAALSNQVGSFLTGRRGGEQFGYLGAVITDAGAAGWPREGLIRWGGIWGNNWALDPKTRTIAVAFTNTMYEGSDGRFRDELRDAVFA